MCTTLSYFGWNTGSSSSLVSDGFYNIQQYIKCYKYTNISFSQVIIPIPGISL
jgi:hypothetical protein